MSPSWFCCGAGKGEGPTRVLLRVLVELLLAKITAENELVTAKRGCYVDRHRIGAIAIERTVGIGERGDAAGKHEGRRPPIGRVLVIATDSGQA